MSSLTYDTHAALEMPVYGMIFIRRGPPCQWVHSHMIHMQLWRCRYMEWYLLDVGHPITEFTHIWYTCSFGDAGIWNDIWWTWATLSVSSLTYDTHAALEMPVYGMIFIRRGPPYQWGSLTYDTHAALEMPVYGMIFIRRGPPTISEFTHIWYTCNFLDASIWNDIY